MVGVTRVGNHPFRSAGVTAYLRNGGTLERGVRMANHAGTRTTQLYDRRAEEVTLDEVELVLICKSWDGAMTKPAKLRDDEEFAISAVGKEFSVNWRFGENPPDAYLLMPSHEVAIEISTLVQLIRDDRGERSRISDDAPGIELVNRLNAELQHLIPNDVCIGIAVRSPLLKVRKTRAALVQILREKLPEMTRSDAVTELCLNGNRIQFCRYPRSPSDRPKIWGIATHGSSSPDIGLNAQSTLADRINEKAEKCKKIGELMPIWLVLLNEYWVFADFSG